MRRYRWFLWFFGSVSVGFFRLDHVFLLQDLYSTCISWKWKCICKMSDCKFHIQTASSFYVHWNEFLHVLPEYEYQGFLFQLLQIHKYHTIFFRQMVLFKPFHAFEGLGLHWGTLKTYFTTDFQINDKWHHWGTLKTKVQNFSVFSFQWFLFLNFYCKSCSHKASI